MCHLMGFHSCAKQESCAFLYPCGYHLGQDKFWGTEWYWLWIGYSPITFLHLSKNYMIKRKWCLKPFLNSIYIFSKGFVWYVLICEVYYYNLVHVYLVPWSNQDNWCLSESLHIETTNIRHKELTENDLYVLKPQIQPLVTHLLQ